MIELPQEIAIGRAHSKLILIGEHAVVYGKPAIALPFPMVEVKSIVEKRPGPIRITSRYYQGPLEQIPKKMEGISACIKATLDALHKPMNDLHIQLESTIPIGRGLGSSAAIAIAIVRSLFSFCSQELSKKELLALVNIAEKFAHGNPSGIDMAAACSDHPIWFEKQAQTSPLFIGASFYLVVADSGRIGDTHAAVKSIRDNYQQDATRIDHAITKLGELTLQAREALFNGNKTLLGNVMNEAHYQLNGLGVSDAGLNDMVSVARKAGALGAKVTGGGRGGCILALARNLSDAQYIADTLKQAGASDTWHFTLSQNV